MGDKLQLFEDYLKNNKKSSSSTIEAYLRDVKQFINYCSTDEFLNIDFAKISEYITYLNKSEATKMRIAASLKAYFNCLKENGIVLENPVENIKIKKKDPKKLNVLEAEEIICLLSQPNGDDFKSLRDKAMLELLYATGIKVSELLKVEINDVNLAVGILHLKNGDKERIVPIYPAAVKSLENYILNAREGIIDSESQEILFTNLNGQPMSRQGFWKIIKFYAEKAGIRKDITPQTLRHSFATHLLENGAKLQDIKEMLGHSDISSTQVYAQFVKNKYASKYAKFHPLAK
ncbi:MAG: tyrosine-type recombinase/integrase [Clostridia bacterium]|nr:tyrosine-type recombinase/integrase [Clostridia bacterium]